MEKTRDQTPENSTRLLGKLDKWQWEIERIQSLLRKIRYELGPSLENILNIKIPDKEILQVAMFQPSTKNLFLELATQYADEPEDPLGEDGFDTLVSLSDQAKALALLGDAAISMAVVHHLWKPKAADVGTLTQQRAEIVSNEHMASICNRWRLYEHRIHFDPGESSREEIEHDKGTLLEAIYGIILIEHGFDQVMDSVKHLFP
jgi:ribonuclease-3